jgi:hypothetical protein
LFPCRADVGSLLVENAPTVPTTKHTTKASKLADLDDFEVLQHKIEMVHQKLARRAELGLKRSARTRRAHHSLLHREELWQENRLEQLELSAELSQPIMGILNKIVEFSREHFPHFV